MLKYCVAAAVAGLLASAASATISFTYTSTSSDPEASFSFTLPDSFVPASFTATSFTTGPVTASSNTIYTPITYADDFTFYSAGGFDSFFDVYFGPVVFTGTTSAPTFLNGSFLMDNLEEEGTLVISGAAQPAAVPEPAGWAMMIAGFGMIGSAMRRRQRVTLRFG